MIETELDIRINRKSDILIIADSLKQQKIQSPIFIMEYENHFQIKLRSNYEEWELDSVLLNLFPDYEFTENVDCRRKEIRLQLSRYQSAFCTDNWGRPIENPLNETKNLIKKSSEKSLRFNPQIKVLFEDNEQQYFINIINGINKKTEEEGFLLLNEFKFKNDKNDVEILKDRLYKTQIEAFDSGYNKIQELVNNDFNKYVEIKKKEKREQQKLPRKIIRYFINSCNKSENEGIFKDLNEDVIFEKRINWQLKIRIEGIKRLKEYLESPSQEFCARNLKIRSSWDFNLSSITIGVKFLTESNNNETVLENILQYSRITFELKDDKIIHITEEN
jgi:hypothetical protein